MTFARRLTILLSFFWALLPAFAQEQADTDSLVRLMSAQSVHIVEREGEKVRDWYGRVVPKPVHATATLPQPSSSARLITQAIIRLYDSMVDASLLVRRITIGTYNVTPAAQQNTSDVQLDLFSDPEVVEAQRKKEQESLAREQRMQKATLAIKRKFGKNAILRGTDFEEGATARDRNRQIGGHKA